MNCKLMWMSLALVVGCIVACAESRVIHSNYDQDLVEGQDNLLDRLIRSADNDDDDDDDKEESAVKNGDNDDEKEENDMKYDDNTGKKSDSAKNEKNSKKQKDEENEMKKEAKKSDEKKTDLKKEKDSKKSDDEKNEKKKEKEAKKSDDEKKNSKKPDDKDGTKKEKEAKKSDDEKTDLKKEKDSKKPDDKEKQAKKTNDKNETKKEKDSTKSDEKKSSEKPDDKNETNKEKEAKKSDDEKKNSEKAENDIGEKKGSSEAEVNEDSNSGESASSEDVDDNSESESSEEDESSNEDDSDHATTVSIGQTESTASSQNCECIESDGNRVFILNDEQVFLGSSNDSLVDAISSNNSAALDDLIASAYGNNETMNGTSESSAVNVTRLKWARELFNSSSAANCSCSVEQVEQQQADQSTVGTDGINEVTDEQPDGNVTEPDNKSEQTQNPEIDEVIEIIEENRVDPKPENAGNNENADSDAVEVVGQNARISVMNIKQPKDSNQPDLDSKNLRVDQIRRQECGLLYKHNHKGLDGMSETILRALRSGINLNNVNGSTSITIAIAGNGGTIRIDSDGSVQSENYTSDKANVKVAVVKAQKKTETLPDESNDEAK